MDTHADVIVVGAGLAGLSAARSLARRGFEVAVLEARDRVGGRVHSVPIDGTVVDLGGQWIGPGQERAYRLASEAGVSLTSTYTSGQTVYALDGRIRRGGHLPPLGSLSLLDAHRIQRRLERLANAATSRPTAAMQALDAVSTERWLHSVGWTRGAKAFWRLLLEAGACATAGEVSTLALAHQLKTMGGTGPLETAEQDFVVGGAGQLAQQLMVEISDCVHPGEPVERIEHGAEGVCVLTAHGKWQALAVIVAMPPALAARIAYSPILPALRDGLTQRFGQGAVVKCLCVYDHPFWREDGLSGALLDATGPITATLDGTASREGPGVLVALATGAHARSLGTEPPERRRELVLNALARAFGPAAAKPMAYRDHDWSADEWARGGYGAIAAPGVLSAFGPALAAPVGRIFWAGTETASAWRNYMEGALESGERAAKEVTSHLDAKAATLP
ncbi:flavin monoamine oxidase family protein [Algiphilus sp.]|uniref:flavin monoamine oxidase family protein n=1 Tax=Algiphilus sp. TaxID=1872431 RepID=UPI003B5275B3